MSDSFEFKIDGLDDLVRDLQAFGDAGIRRLKPALKDATEIIAATARMKAPVGTRTEEAALKKGGIKLKNGIVVKVSNYRKGSYKVSGYIGLAPGAAHGVPVELGHRLVYFGRKTLRHVAERPFLRPAADESKNAVATIMTEAINQALEELKK